MVKITADSMRKKSGSMASGVLGLCEAAIINAKSRSFATPALNINLLKNADSVYRKQVDSAKKELKSRGFNVVEQEYTVSYGGGYLYIDWMES